MFLESESKSSTPNPNPAESESGFVIYSSESESSPKSSESGFESGSRLGFAHCWLTNYVSSFIANVLPWSRLIGTFPLNNHPDSLTCLTSFLLVPDKRIMYNVHPCISIPSQLSVDCKSVHLDWIDSRMRHEISDIMMLCEKKTV